MLPYVAYVTRQRTGSQWRSKEKCMTWQKAEKQENGINNYVNISKVQLYLSCIETFIMYRDKRHGSMTRSTWMSILAAYPQSKGCFRNCMLRAFIRFSQISVVYPVPASTKIWGNTKVTLSTGMDIKRACQCMREMIGHHTNESKATISNHQ